MEVIVTLDMKISPVPVQIWRDLEQAARNEDGSQILTITEAVYDRQTIANADAERLLGYAERVDDFDAYKARSLYAEAFGHSGRKYHVLCKRLGRDPRLAKLIEFLKKRPAGKRHGPFIADLEIRLTHNNANEPPRIIPGEKAKPAQVDLVFAGAGTTSKELQSVLRDFHNPKIQIVFQDAKLREAVLQELTPEERARCEIRNIAKLDFEADTHVFAASDELADTFMHCLCARISAQAEKDFFTERTQALRTLVRDGVSHMLRTEYSLREVFKSPSLQNIVCLGDLLAATALSISIDPSIFFFDSQSILSGYYRLRKGDAERKFLVERLIVEAVSFDHRGFVLPPTRDQENAVVFYGRLADKISFGSINSLIPKLAKRTPVILEPGWCKEEDKEQHRPGFSSSSLANSTEGAGAFVAWLAQREVFSYWHAFPLDAAFQHAIEDVLSESSQHSSLVTGGVLTWQLSLSRIRRLMRAMLSVEAQWDAVIRQSSGVVVCAGRLPTGLAFATLAKRHRKPSYELQGAAISDTGRYVAPLAQTVFVNEEVSYDVWNDHLGVEKERLRLIGSPRLDESLQNARSVNAREARVVCFGGGVSRDDRIILFASQPFERAISDDIFQCFVSATRMIDPEYKIIIRPHPTESSEQLESYIQILTEAQFPKNRILESSFSGLEIQAADIICTYFSNVGLEGLALEKKVVCVAPKSESTPIFELSKLGAYGPYSEPSALAEELQAPHRLSERDRTVLINGDAVSKILSSFERDGVLL